MKKSYRFLITALFLGAYLLSACNGVMPSQDDSSQGPAGSSQSTDAVFTGTIESMEGTQWLISGQLISVDDSSSVDPNIQVGDVVKVEASVSADGSVIAVKIELPGMDDANANDNAVNDNDSNTNDGNVNMNDNTNSSNENGSGISNANSNDSMGVNPEAYGIVEAITDNSITIDGVSYNLADFTEFKGLIVVGDQVKIEIIVNTDGTFTIREIEKSISIGDDNSNNNNNSNYNSNSNGDDHLNNNSNDDHGDDNSNSNSNDDDDHEDDNSNGSNSNDD